MEKEKVNVGMGNRVYEFIGELALSLYKSNVSNITGNDFVKVNYSTLIKLIQDNLDELYGSERGVARAISASYRRWKRLEDEGIVSGYTNAISKVFVNQNGYPSYNDY